MTARADNAGVFRIGGELSVRRLGFGAMRILGPGFWGPPADVDGALALLRLAADRGIDFFDTADAYGPDVSEQLIARALHPYTGMCIATKAGMLRTGPDQWYPEGRPEYLIQQVHKSLRTLRIDRIDLWQLHRIDPRIPEDEQFSAIRTLLDRGLIRHAGLSEVSVAQLRRAATFFPVATVQNRYNLVERTHEDVLTYAAEHGIGFIPWSPLSAGELARPGGLLTTIADKYGATSSQIALAWLLQRSPVILPIPGTSDRAHLLSNLAAAGIALDREDCLALDADGLAHFRRYGSRVPVGARKSASSE